MYNFDVRTVIILAIKLTKKCCISDNRRLVKEFCFVENNLFHFEIFHVFSNEDYRGEGMEVDKATNEFTEHLPANSPMRTV